MERGSWLEFSFKHASQPINVTQNWQFLNLSERANIVFLLYGISNDIRNKIQSLFEII